MVRSSRAVRTERVHETRVRRVGRKVVKSIFGDSAVTERAKLAYRKSTALEGVKRRTTHDALIDSGPGTLVLTSRTDPEPKRGLFLWGGCDLPSAFHMERMLLRDLRGTIAMHKPEGTSLARCASGISLGSLDPPPAEVAAETIERMGLPVDYFEPELFEPEFDIPGSDLGPFPKSVVVLSLGGEIIRTLYSHREYGFVVDPGGNWLTAITRGELDSAPVDREQIAWFNKHFKRLPRSTPEAMAERYRRLIPEIKRRTRGQVVLLNTLTVEPGDRTHNFQLRRTPESARRRDFHVAATELSAELGFSIVDVDRILKQHGILRQLDFAHFPEDLMVPVAAELHRILRKMAVV
jgi:hypothetical protein